MAERKLKIFVVRPRESRPALPGARFVLDGEVLEARLIRAKSEAAVTAYIAQDFEIAPATADEIHALGKADVEIEEAGE